MSDLCLWCGHAKVFHQTGTGNGVPVGVEYCDDRHADPCSCNGFVEERRERPRLEKTRCLFHDGCPHYYRDTFPVNNNDEWIEVVW